MIPACHWNQVLGTSCCSGADTVVDAPFSASTRTDALADAAAAPVDLLVVGGGITGAGIARDAAMRGFRTALVDKGDFGSGTSSRSSRLIHGGLRYLEHGRLRLVFEASRERRTLLRIAPHLVRPRSFLVPVHRGARVPLWKLAAGLWLYDLLAVFRNVRSHELLGKRALRRAEPSLRSGGLRGGGRYYDAQCDDARLTLANVRDAHRYGALAANYVRVDRLAVADGRVGGAHVTDLVTGEEALLRAAVVVNATGPWSDAFRQETDQPVLCLSKGAHVIVPRWRLGNNEALTLTSPIDGRVVFIVPLGDFSYIGTTETTDQIDPDAAYASGDDVIYLLRSANAFFPEARLGPDDVQATWAGIRPLARSGDVGQPGSVSREHQVLEHPSGLVSIVGGKLTTFRVMAADVTDVVARRLHELDGRPVPARAPTAEEPLPGGETRELDVLVSGATDDGMPRAIAEHLVECYGSETPAVVRLAKSEPQLQRPVVAGLPVIWAQLIHALRREMALTLGDLLIRRTPVFYEAPEHGLEVAEAVVDAVADEAGWDAARRAAELEVYAQQVDEMLRFRTELEDAG
jgi:glycerol-3-phosphate dehydrogenase